MNNAQFAQLNNMINNMNNVNICDANCQKRKKVDRLRTQYKNAENKLQNAPAEIKATRQAYYLEDPAKGSEYYNQYMEKKYKDDFAQWECFSVIRNPVDRVCSAFRAFKDLPDVSFEQFVRPSLRKVLGCSDLTHKTVQAKLTQTIQKKPGRLHFLSSIVSWAEGECTVTPAGEQGSGILKSAANANGLLIFPLEAAEIKQGQEVAVQLLE